MNSGMSRFMRNGFIASMGAIIALGLLASFLPGGADEGSDPTRRPQAPGAHSQRSADRSQKDAAGSQSLSFWQGAGALVSSIQNQLGLGEAAEPILVVFVESPREVARVRAAVADERIAAESPNGFALREGRIIAAGSDAAGELVSAAGWIDRKLELMRARKQSPSRRTAATGEQGIGGLAPERLAELLSKDTLSYAEASELLDHI